MRDGSEVSSERTGAEMMFSEARVSRYSTGGKVEARKRKQARARSSAHMWCWALGLQ